MNLTCHVSRLWHLWLLWLLCLPVACASAGPKTIPLTVGGQTLSVELARTPSEQAHGLMYRKSLDEDAGMLFVYPSSAPTSFWMKNTLIPLSIAFIDSQKRIVNMADMAPLNEHKTYPSRGPVQYVLEVNQGWFKAHGIREGDRVEFELPRSR